MNGTASDLPPESPYALSVVVPVYNEADGILSFHRRLFTVVNDLQLAFEVIYVDDGSRDRSFEILKQLHAADSRVSVVRFSRNFGREQALTAGLRAAQGEAVVIIEANLRQPPEVIPGMLQAWRSGGVDLINMRPRSRREESWSKRATSRTLDDVIKRLSGVPIPIDIGDFRLLSRRAVDAVNRLEERNRCMNGLFAWIGLRQTTLDYDVDERFADQNKRQFRQAWKFAIEELIAFSTKPLKLASYVGMVGALLAFVYGIFFVLKALFLGDPSHGFPTLVVTMLFIGGLQLMVTSIVGWYLSGLCIENKRRPLYLIEEYVPATQGGAR